MLTTYVTALIFESRLLLVLTKTQSTLIEVRNYEALQWDFRCFFSEIQPKPGSASRELHGSSFKQKQLWGLNQTQPSRPVDTHNKSELTAVFSRAKFVPRSLGNISN